MVIAPARFDCTLDRRSFARFDCTLDRRFLIGYLTIVFNLIGRCYVPQLENPYRYRNIPATFTTGLDFPSLRIDPQFQKSTNAYESTILGCLSFALQDGEAPRVIVLHDLSSASWICALRMSAATKCTNGCSGRYHDLTGTGPLRRQLLDHR